MYGRVISEQWIGNDVRGVGLLPIWRYYHGTCPEGLRETTEIRSQDYWCSGLDRTFGKRNKNIFMTLGKRLCYTLFLKYVRMTPVFFVIFLFYPFEFRLCLSGCLTVPALLWWQYLHLRSARRRLRFCVMLHQAITMSLETLNLF
jgi:hypothetical protein